MKTRILFFICILFALYDVKAQKISDSKVPQDVIISCRYKYPDATVSYWEKQDENYVARFKMNNQNGYAEFDEKGLWIKTRFEIKEKELPSSVVSYYKENYFANEYVMSVIEIHKTSQGKSYYYIQLKREGVTQVLPVDLQFDLAGTLIYKNDPGEAKTNDDKNSQSGNTNAAVIETPDDGSKYLVPDNKVPAVATTHFKSKNKKASGAAWYFRDQKYTVKYNSAGRNALSMYTKEGAWLETRVESSEDKLNQLVVTYLKDNYRQYKIKTVEFVTQPKDKSIEISMYDKRSNATPPPITKIWFTSAGKYVNVEKPDIDDPNEREAQKRRDEKDKKFMEDVDKSGVVYEDAENYNDKVNKKELPSSIHDYIKKNYKEHVISSSRLVSDDDLGNVYLIRVKIEGAKYGTQLFFDIAGNFLKKIEESESRMNKENIDPGATTNEASGSKFGTSDERISQGELPSEITKYLKKNYPGHEIKESYFKTDKDLGNCFLSIMQKAGEKKITKLYFDLDGNLARTLFEN